MIKFDNLNQFKASLEAGKITVPRFVSIRGYENSKSEISNQLINLGVNYANMVQNEIDRLQSLKIEDFESENMTIELLKDAHTKLLDTMHRNISKEKEDHTNQSKAQRDAYTYLLPNVKYHNDTGHVYITGLLVNKTIIKEGNYPKPSKSRPLTIAKRVLSKDSKLNKYRIFRLDRFSCIRLNGQELIFEN